MRILFLFAALIFMTNCEKSDLVTMLYAETQCSDVWMIYRTSENTTEEAITIYFEKEHDIELTNIQIETVSTGIFCNACDCTSGREIQVNIDEKLISTLEFEGFVRK